MLRILWALIVKLFQLIGLLIFAVAGFGVFSAIGGFEVVKQFTDMDPCRQYSAYACNQLENMPYNVYFYYPGGEEYYLGRSESLSMCGSRARSQAARTNDLKGYEKNLPSCSPKGRMVSLPERFLPKISEEVFTG